MIRTISVHAVACAMISFSLSAAAAQTLTLEVELADLEAWISNNTAAPIEAIGFTIDSNSGILDPTKWRSIADVGALDPAAVSAALGSGATTFTELGATIAGLAEYNFDGVGTWNAGTRWSIGFPFGTSLSTFHSRPFDAIFKFTNPSGLRQQTPIVLIPVPEPAAISIAGLALAGMLLAFRGHQRAGEGYRRTGRSIQVAFKSANNAAIRRDLIESDGPRLIRKVF